MSTGIYHLSDAWHATMLAALLHYEACLLDPARYPAAVHDIATNAGAVTPLTADEVGQLREGLNHHGLEFGDIVSLIGEDEINPYVAAAHEHRLVSEGTLEVDAKTIVSEGEDGAYVMAWLWVEAPAGGDGDEEDIA